MRGRGQPQFENARCVKNLKARTRTTALWKLYFDDLVPLQWLLVVALWLLMLVFRLIMSWLCWFYGFNDEIGILGRLTWSSFDISDDNVDNKFSHVRTCSLHAWLYRLLKKTIRCTTLFLRIGLHFFVVWILRYRTVQRESGFLLSRVTLMVPLEIVADKMLTFCLELFFYNFWMRRLSVFDVR